MNITIFGATGMIGLPLAQELVKAGFNVTAMVRDPGHARKKLPEGLNLIKGDLENIADIQKAIEGADGAYLNLSVLPHSKEKDFQPEREGLDNFLKASRGSGIKFISYTSSLVQRYQGMNGFNWWVFDIKQQAVEKLKNQPIPSLIFYPSTFMENFGPGSYRQGKRILLAGKSLMPMFFIAGSDFGKQAVAAINKFSGESKEYIIQGPEAFTADDAARAFIKNRQPEKYTIIKMPFGILKILSPLGSTFNYGRHIVEALNNYPEQFEAGEAWEELGKPEVTLSNYSKNFTL